MYAYNTICSTTIDDPLITAINTRIQSAYKNGDTVKSVDETTGEVSVNSHVAGCSGGPRKVLHYQPNAYYSPPIWKSSCDQLNCKHPECIATKSKNNTAFVRVYRNNGNKWVSTCENVSYVNHLDCKCKECEDIQNFLECFNHTSTCPNSPINKKRLNCHWNLLRGNCHCCMHSGICKNPKHMFNPEKCRCTCPALLICRTGHVFDFKCCSCRPLSCSKNQIWDRKICKCRCRGKKLCDLPEIKLNAVRKCPNVQKCAADFKWDDDCCKCRPLKCPGREIWHKLSCKCECPRFHLCRPGQLWDHKLCKCYYY